MGKFEITEELLSELELLESVIKNNVAGMFGGNRKSKSFGSSPEFADYRDYADGDDVTKIDWNAYARFDKLYLKLYLDERQMHTRIYIDASRSMEHSGEEKREQCLKLAAAFAYLSVSEMDKVSIYAIHGGTADEVISAMVGKESYLNCINALNEIGLTCFEPKGAFYVFADISCTGMTSEEFCVNLLQKNRWFQWQYANDSFLQV